MFMRNKICKMMLSYLALISVLGVVSTDSNTLTTAAPETRRTTFSLQPHSITSERDNSTSCTLEDGERGECVPYYMCDSNNTVITDGTFIIDIRIHDSPSCKSYLETCCRLLDRRASDDPITPAPPREPLHGCGVRNKDGLGFNIVGAKDGEANYGEFPWMVLIFERQQIVGSTDTKDVYLCGGSLIHPRVVLTVAHKVVDSELSNLILRAGDWDIETTKELYPHQNRKASEVVVHEDFNPINAHYDIALVFVAKAFKMAPNVGVICLPPPNVRADAGAKCITSGWGKNRFGKQGKYQNILKKVEVPVVARSKCQDVLRNTRLGRLFKLHESFMCAGGEPGVDTCTGDGGSPLVCPVNNSDRYVQNGIVAWGIGCGEDDIPGVYADVAHLRSWIDEKLQGKGFDSVEYT